ncbi:nucleocapsid [Chagres virus]|uniref:Nucleoprotein n=2 Tax=Chagres virus TaxID=629727 RepID=I1T326_9VIRU|nr:nucleocapsid [Chagres virus]AEL29643.1 nucleocapsid [Chagres virus]
MANYQDIAVEFAGDLPTEAIIRTWVEEFAYQGFDASQVLRILAERGGANWREDAKKMIILSLTRGNKPSKMMERMSEAGKATVSSLMTRYNLKSGNPGRNDLTLSRVATALAGWTCQAIPIVQDFLPVTGVVMDGLSPAYPRPMMHPCFAGLIDPSLPKKTVDELVAAFSLYMLQFSKTINPSLRAAKREDIISSFRQPMQAAINSTFLTGAQRRQFLRTLGVVNDNLEPSQNVVAAARVFRGTGV